MAKNDSWLSNVLTTVMLLMFLFVNTCSLKNEERQLGLFILKAYITYMFIDAEETHCIGF